MSEAERFHAMGAMQQAEKIADAFLWVRNKLASIGHAFLKPSLKH